MDFADKYITNITKDDVKYACTYKVHASYVFVGIIVTWILSIMSTILTTLFLSSVFITIVNVSRRNRDGDEVNITLSKLNESSSEDEDSEGEDSEVEDSNDKETGNSDSGDSNEDGDENPVNSLSDSVLNDSDEVVMERDNSENKKVN
jgi:hypothetical protein